MSIILKVKYPPSSQTACSLYKTTSLSSSLGEALFDSPYMTFRFLVYSTAFYINTPNPIKQTNITAIADKIPITVKTAVLFLPPFLTMSLQFRVVGIDGV